MTSHTKTVGTELSTDDWDVVVDVDTWCLAGLTLPMPVTACQQQLDSTLLSQVRVATRDQSRRTRVRLTIVSLDTPATIATLLTIDTEVGITPESHKEIETKTKDSSSTSIELGTVPST
ncbi:uncharacterized protein EDB91DRAFT_46189 [Suillus paluster]|uniref:uncharacterized protein n=1 Tax=Suillus paluster TaxID=48578 RepID=UPI001B885FEC|nr:uncharacterized protein EDB91DRAFT_46189 [Suillus paluster]KAG1747810.1 hypothetical protein EDB91DRAFT_46189 [Suillus paluster]